MSVKTGLVVDYAAAFQGIEIAPDHAPKIAGELDRLIAGLSAISGSLHFSDDPAEFLATLAELRDPSSR